MKRVVKIGESKYYVRDEEDLIFLVHLLASLDYSEEEIARKLGISRKRVRIYLEDCW